jgi:hypothetical protein
MVWGFVVPHVLTFTVDGLWSSSSVLSILRSLQSGRSSSSKYMVWGSVVPHVLTFTVDGLWSSSSVLSILRSLLAAAEAAHGSGLFSSFMH